jgi:hypothetical protein
MKKDQVENKNVKKTQKENIRTRGYKTKMRMFGEWKETRSTLDLVGRECKVAEKRESAYKKADEKWNGREEGMGVFKGNCC